MPAAVLFGERVYRTDPPPRGAAGRLEPAKLPPGEDATLRSDVHVPQRERLLVEHGPLVEQPPLVGGVFAKRPQGLLVAGRQFEGAHERLELLGELAVTDG